MGTRVIQLSLPKTHKIDIEFTDLNYKARMGFREPIKHILRNTNGYFKSGDLTAIMGPSGAGKSTLLNILTGFERNNWTGRIEYVTEDSKQKWDQYKKQACYIQQDDQLHPLFTTSEVMLLAANLKIGTSLNRKAKHMLIDDILESLDLAKAKNTRCDRLSGGQKKRLSIALELIDNPPVMFLDEPTTGLDSLSSFQCVSVLRSLARNGRTIVCTIHQPSAAIFELFDHVYILAEGRCMYQGAPKSTVPYFASQGFQCPQYHNPADYMLEVVSKEFGDFNDQLAQAAMNSGTTWRSTETQKLQFQQEAGKTAILITPPFEITRFCILFNHLMTQQYRDWVFSHLRLLIHSLVGFFMGIFYTDAGTSGRKSISNIGFFLVSVVYLCYTSMMPAVFRVPSELPVIRKERFNNWYQLRTYYAALLLSHIPMQMIFTISYTSISYFLSSQPAEFDRFLMFAGMTLLTSLVADSTGLVIGVLVNPVNGTFIGAVLTATFLLFGGFLVLFKHMPTALWYVSHLSYLKYSIHGIVQAIYGNNREKLACPDAPYYCHYRLPQLLMEDFAMTDSSYTRDVIVLLSCLFCFRLLGYCTLKRKLMSV